MNAEAPETSQPGVNSPEQLSRLLEIELIQKRAEWQRASARYKNIKAFSLFFLFLIILAGLAAFYFAFMKANEVRQRPPQTAQDPGHP
jgi:hypothetical protein